jgi:hypothetical protein
VKTPTVLLHGIAPAGELFYEWSDSLRRPVIARRKAIQQLSGTPKVPVLLRRYGATSSPSLDDQLQYSPVTDVPDMTCQSHTCQLNRSYAMSVTVIPRQGVGYLNSTVCRSWRTPQ